MNLASILQLLLLLATAARPQSFEARDYFKKCLHLKQEWHNSRTDEAADPSHPLAAEKNAMEGHQPKKSVCRTYKCLKHSSELDLDRLSNFKCSSDNDCAREMSGMVCAQMGLFPGRDRQCTCPPGYAYSTNECRCLPAELCWSSTDPCHKGMKCNEPSCSCRRLQEPNVLLYEIHGGFCVEQRSTHFEVDYLLGGDESHATAEVIAVAVIAAIVILGLIALGLYILGVKRKDIDFFARGDYVCEHDNITPGNRHNQPHVAAWDAPGMDFLSEEQTLKYINRSNSIEIDQKSPSVATTAELVHNSDESPTPSGSLPESDQNNTNSEIRNRIHESNFANPTFSSGNAREGPTSTKDGSDEENNEVTKSSSML